MRVSTKIVRIKNHLKGLIISVTTKRKVDCNSISKGVIKKDIIYKSLKSISTLKNIKIKSSIKELILNSYNFIPLKKLEVDQKPPTIADPSLVVDNSVSVSHLFPEGWSTFSIPLNLMKAVNTYNQTVGYEVGDTINYTELGFDIFLKNNLYESESDDTPLYYKDQNAYTESVITAKNNAGQVYIPQYDFNGMGNISQYQGYLIKLSTKLTLRLKSEKLSEVNYFSDYASHFSDGWNIIGYPTFKHIDAKEFFSTYIDSLAVAKNNDGDVYIPQYDFNGIGDLTPFQGYQIKLKNTQ